MICDDDDDIDCLYVQVKTTFFSFLFKSKIKELRCVFIEGVTTVEFLGQANGIFGNKKWNLMEFLELEFPELNGNGRVKYDIDDLF